MSSPIKLSWKSEWVIVLLLILSVIASFWFYNHMPDIVPVHWDISGQANGFSSRAFAAFFFPALIVAIYLLMIFLPYLDPKKERYQDFEKVYFALRLIFVLFFDIIYFAASLVGVGYDVPIGPVVTISVGLMFMIIGNYLGKVKMNWFVGIRTPWTLSSEEVWNKTHRLGGKLFFLSGILLIMSGYLPGKLAFPLLLVIIILMSGGTVLYSYILYRKTSISTPKNSGDDKA